MSGEMHLMHTDLMVVYNAPSSRWPAVQKEDVFIKGLEGKTYTFNIELSASVGYLMSLIEDRLGISAAQQRLIFAGKQFVRERSLSDHGVTPEATLHLVQRLCGGKASHAEPNHHCRVGTTM